MASNLDRNEKLYNIIESQVIIAMLNGNFRNKEILIFINEQSCITFSRVEYTVKKLLKKFSACRRSELIRKILKANIAYITLNLTYLSINDNE